MYTHIAGCKRRSTASTRLLIELTTISDKSYTQQCSLTRSTTTTTATTSRHHHHKHIIIIHIGYNMISVTHKIQLCHYLIIRTEKCSNCSVAIIWLVASVLYTINTICCPLYRWWLSIHGFISMSEHTYMRDMCGKLLPIIYSH